MTAEATIHLPLDLYSPEQLSAVIIELRGYISALRDTAVRAKAAHATAGTPHASALLLGTMHESATKATDQADTEKLLKQLEAIRDKAPTAHLLMAALPNRELKRKMTDWFRTEIHPFALLTFAVRADIGGGFILQTGSHVYNYSFREQILSHKSRISEIYNSVRQ